MFSTVKLNGTTLKYVKEAEGGYLTRVVTSNNPFYNVGELVIITYGQVANSPKTY